MSSPNANILTAVDVPLAGLLYAFDASGGFAMEQGFSTITTLPSAPFTNFDVTNALQVVLDVAVFNEKLGLFKDYAAGSITTTSYDETTQEFDVSSITISASDFKTALPHYNRIISTGAYASMYTNFENYVKQYFGYPGGFASLFNQATLFDLSANDKENLHKLLVPVSPDTSGFTDIGEGDEISGNYIKDLSGSIVISNITQLLRYAVDTNVFSNRDPSGNSVPNNDSADPSGNTYNFGVGDGFMAGDLIWVPTGTQITLDLDISAEIYENPFNNPNSSTASTFSGLDTSTTATDSAITTLVTSGDYSSVSTVTRKNINRVLKAPLLIRLANAADLPAAPE
jgi:hypothetical protein